MLDLAFCWLTSPPLSVLQWEDSPDLGTSGLQWQLQGSWSPTAETATRSCDYTWGSVPPFTNCTAVHTEWQQIRGKTTDHVWRLTWHVASSTNNWLDSFWFVVRYLFVMSPQTTDIGVKLLIRVHWSCTALLYILTVSEDVVYTNRIMSVSKNRWL